MSLSGLPFDDIRDLVHKLPEGDMAAGQLARSRAEDLAQVFGPQERHAMLAEWLATWTGKSPSVTRPMLALFAGNHAISKRLGSVKGESTLDTVTRLAAGGGAVNQNCAGFDIGLKVFDLALQYPVADISQEDALDENGSAATIGFGMEAIAGGVDVLGLAAFGQGSELANSTIMTLALDKSSAIGPDENLDQNLVQQVIEHHNSAKINPLELLRRVGGREHSAIAGAILAARVNHVAVVLEGMTAAAIVLLLQKLNPGLCDHCCFAGVPSGSEKSLQIYRAAIEQSNLHCVIDGFGVANDGANAALSLGILKTIANQHRDSVIIAS